ncbi:MAG: ABC transporter ATP-binding protein [Dehalococcoidia bacterium]
MATDRPIIELRAAGKTFGRRTVLDTLTLDMDAGRIHGLIGPSGCGKTTLVRLLVGALAPTAGAVRVFGADPTAFTPAHRERIGYTPQGFVLYPTLTVAENARFVAGLYGVAPWRRGRRVRELFQFLEIWEARRRLARDISGGMQRRLALACALIHRPSLLFVDEPTAGLDPILREKIWDYLRRLRDRGVTVVVTTQYIDEAVYCDSVAVMTDGRVVAVGSPDELRRRVQGGEAVVVEADRFGRADMVALWQEPAVQWIEPAGPGALRITVDDAVAATPAITQALQSRGVELRGVRPHIATFDEVFRAIVNAHG